MRIDLGDEEQPEIGLTALIDCIFFLLMFFMVATSFKQQTTQRKDKQLPIALPVSSNALEESDDNARPLVIGVGRDGKLYLEGEAVTAQGLHSRLRAVAAADAGTHIRIDGDKQAAYQHIVRVMDLCQIEGLHNIAMRTRN
jgi:biopolymer transport protein ExbD